MILHFVSNLTELAGGLPRSTRGLAAALARCGVENEIWTTDFSFDAAAEPGRRAGESVVDGVRVESFALDRPRPLRRSRRLVAELGRRRGEIEAIHVHGVWFPAGSQAMRWARRNRVPCLVRPAGMLAEPCFRLHSAKKRIYLRLFEARNLASASAIHWATAGERAATRRGLLPADAAGFELPNGIDEAFLAALASFRREPGESGTFRVGTLGRLDPVKRLDRLAQAASILATRRSGVGLAVAGGDTEGWTGRTREFLGAVDPRLAVELKPALGLEAKVRFLRGLDAFVQASDFESFGLALVEAMAAGVPCVATRSVGIADELAAAGAAEVVDPDPGAIAAALERIAGDPGLRARLAQAGPPFAARFRWHRIAEEMKGRYDELVTERGRR